MKKAGTMFIKNLRYLCLMGVISLGLMTIVGTGGGGGGGSSTPTYSSEYRGSYIDVDDPSDTGSWSMAFNQGGSSVSGIVTADEGEKHAFTGSITGDTLTIQDSEIIITLVISGNEIVGTAHETGGDTYNLTATIYSGNSLKPLTPPAPLIGGTPVDGNPPFPTPDANSPVISNLTVNPASGPSGTQITIKLHFDDNDANVVTFGIQFLTETKYYSYDVSGVTSGFAAFNLNVTDIVGDIAPGTYQVGVFLVDESGNVSNYLYSTFTVTGTGGLSSIVFKDYFPLHDGDTWIATWGPNTAQLTASMETASPYITEPTYAWKTYDNGNPDHCSYFKYDSNGCLMLYGEYDPDYNQFRKPQSPVLGFPKNVELGRTYNIVYQMYYYDVPSTGYFGYEDLNTKLSITGPETINVPAGTFVTYKLRIDETNVEHWTGGGSGTWWTEYYLAKNVGIVKKNANDGKVWVLESATVNGVNY